MTPEKIGPFRIEALLGEGGIGRVYSALDEDLGRMVALKALRPEVSRDAGFIERFRGEAASLARLHHPNITTLYSLHRDGRDAYMVMELVRGFTLEEVIAQWRRVGLQAVRAIAAEACAGLGYAHRMGVIHRDIKPSNLMLTEHGQLKIMDFGIARMRGTQRMTRAGSIVGTLAYMPPEQIKGADNDERSDIYSLACVLYELLCGTPPFHAATEYELIQAQIEQPPAPPRERCRDLDPGVEQAVLRGLAKSPSDRFASAGDFARALGADALGRDAADGARDAIISKMKAAPAKATRVMQASPRQSSPRQSSPRQSSPRQAPRPEGRGVRRDGRRDERRGLPMPALVLGGVALVIAGGVAALFAGSSGGSVTAVTPSSIPSLATARVQAGQPAPLPLPSIPKSDMILPAPDATATVASSLPPSTLAACPPSGASAQGVVQGHVTALSENGWPQIGSSTLPLYGVQSLPSDQQANLQTWLDAKGGDLVCCAVPQGGNRCLTVSTKQDVSLFILINGLAPAAQGAPGRYTDAEQMARQAQRGVWK